ncbi:MAG: hypothetical protein DRZ79_01490 [Candidatus Cloacimonadota bacterium]|nr:MAG: hypothetical protein DRZ79_01490 [Candidatus Cloacimonadota bacterium]
MDLKEINYYYNKFKFGEDNFHNLMKKRVREILLVSTFYDAFIFEQDGQLSEQIHGEYQQLNLSTAPRITSVPTGEEAIKTLQNRKFDLVITMMRIGEVDPFKLSEYIKNNFPDLPILLLLHSTADIPLITQNKSKFIDDVFLWNGDSKIFLAMIKYIEDKRNLETDTRIGLVRVILLIEDSIHYYSRFLPILYAEIMNQTQKLITEEVNDINKRLRMRARPKVILVHNYDDAIKIIEEYREYLISVISDVKYLRSGKEDSQAGIRLLSKVRNDKFDIPMLLQSSEVENREKAKKLKVSFIHKNSKTLLNDLKEFIVRNLGFGDFIFRDKTGKKIDRAVTMQDFEEKLKTIPDESLIFHGSRNHFSAWLTAHGEFQIAKRIRHLKVENFKTSKELREFLISIFEEVQYIRNRGKIVNFSEKALSIKEGIVRLADGSFGGKGRSIAFLNSLLAAMEFEKGFPEVNINIPKTFVIGTKEFDYFLVHNNITYDITSYSDVKIAEIFLNGTLSNKLIYKLNLFVEKINYPLAVRSSGLLEDSQTQPFAGIYQTYMLPNNHPDKAMRFRQLTDAVKLVFASVFQETARQYIESINFKLEEEKMAVIIEQIVGSRYDDYFYPHISGVAQSYNYYPTSYLEHADGIANLALGMGIAVVEGMKTFKFCPRYPKMDILQQEEILKNSQYEFYAINLGKKEFDLREGEITNYIKLDLRDAEKHGSLNYIASSWDYQNERFMEGPYAKGVKVLTFASVLKYNYFPLAEILDNILDIGEKAMGVPVEIEFAVNLNKEKDNKPSFYLLQIRPLTIKPFETSIDPQTLSKKELFIYTGKGMGNGIFENVRDIIFVEQKKFDNTDTMNMISEIDELNRKLNGKKYILIGPGRWGTRDRFLGIPVKWNNIYNAQIIVETSMEGFIVEPSQGTHFFHNLIASNVGYFVVNHKSEKDFIDWKWLARQPIKNRTKYFVHVQLEKPVLIKIDGKKGIGVVFKENKIPTQSS